MKKIGYIILILIISTSSFISFADIPEEEDKILAPAEKNGVWGYINTKGDIVIPFEYDEAEEFSEGLAVAIKDNNKMYIDNIGEVVIPIEYTSFWGFSEGLAKVGINYTYGYIDAQGELIIPIEYDMADSFSEGLASVKKNGKWGYINKLGETIIPHEYDYADPFSEGLASVNKNGKWGYINTQGKVIIPFIYDQYLVQNYMRRFSEGLAVVEKDSKYGYINKLGEIIIPIEYDVAYPFLEGLAAVKKEGREGYINNKGELIISRDIRLSSKGFSEGLAIVSEDDKYGYINTQGDLVITHDYNIDSIDNKFSKGLAKVMKDGKYGYINTQGKVVIPLEYDSVGPFRKVTDYSQVDLNISFDMIDHLKTTEEITDKINSEIEKISTELKEDDELKEDITNLTEYGISKASQQVIDGGESTEVNLTKENIDQSIIEAQKVKSAVEEQLKINGVTLNRPIKTKIDFDIQNTSPQAGVKLNQSEIQGIDVVDELGVNVNDATITLETKAIKEEIGTSDDLEITVDRDEIAQQFNKNQVATLTGGLQGISNITGIAFKKAGTTIDRLKNRVSVGLNIATDNVEYNTVVRIVDGKETLVGGKYDEKTQKLTFKTKEPGSFYVKENNIEFSDLDENTSAEQKAIKVLAAKGMIGGVGNNQYNPQGTLTRSQFAKLIIKALYLEDPNAKADLKDLKETSWDYNYVASAQNEKLISGYEDQTFRGNNTINKNEFITVCSNVLNEEMGYTYPQTVEEYINRYQDEITNWAKNSIALATREAIVVENTERIFKGNSSINRADAAVMLYRLFKKL